MPTRYAGMSCSHTILPHVSTVAGTVSFLSSFIAQIPQLLETYADKTVEGLSPIFLLAWLLGDITSVIGAVLTHQLAFQVILALYFLVNDLFICGQYYYYGILHQNKLATRGHEAMPVEERIATVRSRGSGAVLDARLKRKSWLASLFIFGNGAHGFPLILSAASLTVSPVPPDNSMTIGRILSWAGAMCYVGARIPQLIKNYHRKSTDGLSPFLFLNTLLANTTYTLSIFTSCAYLGSEDKWAFAMNEMPFIVGSAGTIVFDIIYFYQNYVLYAEDMLLRELEARGEEREPLIAAA